LNIVEWHPRMAVVSSRARAPPKRFQCVGGLLADVIQMAGFTLRGIAVWGKTTSRARPRKGGFKQQAEFIVWASKGALPSREVYLPGVFSEPLKLPKQHLTQKPIALAREVARLVPDGGVVCDLFAGSGTFLIAAKEAGLRWVGCETNEAYAALASERLTLGAL